MSKRNRSNTICIYEFQRLTNVPPSFTVYVVGAYDYVEIYDLNGVLIRVYTPFGKKDQGLFALNVS